MEWSDVLNDPTLQDLPYKIELNEYGNIVMTRRTNEHGKRKALAGNYLMDFMPAGDALFNCVIQTGNGVRVADLAWQSDRFLEQHGHMTPYPVAPEICVEVVINSAAEFAEKKLLYFAAGAHEVWFCDEQRKVSFHTAVGEIERSTLIPQFPTVI